LNTLEEKGLRENTIVLYICDNGWGATSTTKDWPRDQAFHSYAMRSKASPYENGTRTPILVSWPGTIEPSTMDGFAHSIDLFPTIAAAAGLKAPAGLPGINLLDEKAVNGRDTIFGEMHSSHNINIGDPDSTLQYHWCIEGDWKLLLRYHGADTTGYRVLHTWDTAPYRLFNLKNDPAEKNDLAAAHPEIVERLAKGDPPRVLRDGNMIVNAYFPGSGNLPREFNQYQYSGRDFAEAIHLCRKEYAPQTSVKSGLRKKKDPFSVNVVFFAPMDTGISEHEEGRFKQFVSLTKGQLRVLDGLEAIESSISGSE
jgi:hypothetical protein